MNVIFYICLALHVLCGFIGLITGTLTLIKKKGDALHKKIGKVFYYVMLIASITSLILATIHPNYFLFIVGVFTLYMVITGNRYLQFKNVGIKPTSTDWLISILMAITSIGFIFFGISYLIKQNNFGIVFLVFGLLSLKLVYTDYKNYSGKFNEKNYWLLSHIQRMVGTYITSLTAFLVVNYTYLPSYIPSWLTWILPTIILTPLIILWTRKHKVKI